MCVCLRIGVTHAHFNVTQNDIKTDELRSNTSNTSNQYAHARKCPDLKTLPLNINASVIIKNTSTSKYLRNSTVQ